MKSSIQAVHSAILHRPDISSFAAIGDPGCEGLGTVMMQTYANVLEQAAQEDMLLIVGDLLPAGEDRFYRDIAHLTDELARQDVYVLRGNHDTGDYASMLGRSTYAIVANGFTLIVLDNAFRTFTDESLALLGQALEADQSGQVILAFHVPLPNRHTGNTVSQEEFDRLRRVYEPHRDKIQFFLCAHVHSRFEDVVDGVPLVCTGGGGAIIEDVSDQILFSDVAHHYVRFFLENGQLRREIVDLTGPRYSRERDNAVLAGELDKTIQNELYAHLNYLSFAERAKKQGRDKLANLFLALADSEYRHARNFFTILHDQAAALPSPRAYIPAETFECDRYYPMMQQAAEEERCYLTAQAYANAAAAEQVHADLLEEAASAAPFAKDTFYVCPDCGFVMDGSSPPPATCPVCGTPGKRLERFSVNA